MGVATLQFDDAARGRRLVTELWYPAAAEGPAAREALQEAAGIKHREHFRKAYLELAMNEGWLERTIPDKPRSPKQRYRMTAAGRRVLSGRV